MSEAGGIWEISAQYCCEFKTVLKNKFYFEREKKKEKERKAGKKQEYFK